MFCSCPISFFRIFLISALVWLFSCSPEKGEDRILLPLDSSAATVVDSLEKQARKVYWTDIDSAIILCENAYRLCTAHNLPEKAREIQSLTGSFYRMSGLHSVAETYLSQSLESWKEAGNKKWIAQIHEERGYNFLEEKSYSKALENMRTALSLWQEVDSTAKIIEAHIDLCIYFTRREKPEIAWKEYTEAHTLLNTYEDVDLTWRLTYAHADLLLLEKRFDEAIQTYLDLDSKETYPNIGFIYKEWGDMMIKTQRQEALQHYRSSQEYHLQSLDLHAKAGAISRLTLDYYNLGAINRRLGLYKSAIDTLKNGIYIAGKNNKPRSSADMYRVLSETYTEINDDSLALSHYKTYTHLRDSLTDVKNARTTRLAEVHYETEKIETERRNIQQDKERKELQLKITLLLTSVIGLLAILYFYRYQSKKKLMEQQAEINSQVVVGLIKEHTIENLNSRIEGQEQEKERIARELHDQLGGTLAAVKFSLEGMEKELPDALKDRFAQTHQLLQSATDETRNLSHEMKGLPLQNLGLDASLKSLGDTLNSSKKLRVHVNSTSISASNISQKSEFHLYRICQELLQNVIKHAQATEVFLQLTYEQDKLTLMVEDNGKGFDPQGNKNGLGMQNIRDRVAQINGKLDFDSSIGQGTTVIIEVPTEPK